MKALYSVCVSVALFCLVLSADEHGANVISLTAEDFPSGTAPTPYFVMFFAPWCGHCKRLAPTWDDLAKKYNVDDGRSKITIAKVDCTVETALCKEHGVSGYPTVKYFNKDMTNERYQEARDRESLEKYIHEKMGIPLPDDSDKPIVRIPKQIQMVTAGLAELTEDNWSTAMSTSHRYFIMFYAPWCGHCKALKPTWMELAKHYTAKGTEDFMLARLDCTAHTKICSQLSISGYPTLMWFAGGKMLEKYQGGREEAQLKKFVDKMLAIEDPSKYSSDGMIPDDETMYTEAEHKPDTGIVDGLHVLTDITFPNTIAKGHTFVKFFAPWCGHCKALAPTWDKLAKDNADNENFRIAKIDCTVYTSVCSQYSVKGYPTLLYFHNGEQVDSYSGSREEANIAAYIKSQQNLLDNLPEEGKAQPESDGGVFELNSMTFADFVKTETTFIMFYAPWCGHCKKLKPTWAELGEFFNGYEDIKIAKLDCTANQEICQQYEVKGYPTLMYFVNGEKREKHGGGRDLESLKSSVEKTLALVVKEGIKKEEAEAAAEEKPAATAEETKPTEGTGTVVELDSTSFKSQIAKDYTFVKFYAPWCGHCKKLAPTWVELAEAIKPNGAVTIAKIDCTVEKDICGEYEVRGYPTLLWFKDGEKIEKYSKGRDLATLKGYVSDNAPAAPAPAEAPAAEEKTEDATEQPTGGVLALTKDTFADAIKSGYTFVKFYAPWCGHCKRLAPTWIELAEKSKKVKIAELDCTEHRDVCSEHKVNGFPTLIMFKDGANAGEHNGGRDLAGLESFVKRHVPKHDEL